MIWCVAIPRVAGGKRVEQKRWAAAGGGWVDEGCGHTCQCTWRPYCGNLKVRELYKMLWGESCEALHLTKYYIQEGLFLHQGRWRSDLLDLASHTSGNHLLHREQESLIPVFFLPSDYVSLLGDSFLSLVCWANKLETESLTAKANHRCLLSFQDVVNTLRNWGSRDKALGCHVGLREQMLGKGSF